MNWRKQRNVRCQAQTCSRGDVAWKKYKFPFNLHFFFLNTFLKTTTTITIKKIKPTIFSKKSMSLFFSHFPATSCHRYCASVADVALNVYKFANLHCLYSSGFILPLWQVPQLI